MKLFLLFVFLIFVGNSSFANEDSVFVKVQTDTVQIWNTDVLANCASRFSLQTEITGNSIVVAECDTIGPIADCHCIYDLHSSLTGLPAGNYSVAVYRQELKKYFYSHDTTIFIDSLTFTLQSSSALQKSVLSKQSACHTATSIEKEEANPETFQLLTNYPNPFNPSTVISYQLAVGSFVTLKIYDVLGNEVAMLVNEEQHSGTHQVTFNPQQIISSHQLSSGVYFYQLKQNNFIITKKMIFLR
ncbi:MAG: T9SS type A sorting domain-containing protein [Ignavibacteriaceae bacterium]|nr:T9SS type A sorting domain-containing protein [Ignavibacteriaceae bacterium]